MIDDRIFLRNSLGDMIPVKESSVSERSKLSSSDTKISYLSHIEFEKENNHTPNNKNKKNIIDIVA